MINSILLKIKASICRLFSRRKGNCDKEISDIQTPDKDQTIGLYQRRRTVGIYRFFRPWTYSFPWQDAILHNPPTSPEDNDHLG